MECLPGNQWIRQPTTADPARSATIPNDPPTQYGWVCPKCGAVWAPWQQQCLQCGNNTTWTVNVGFDNSYTVECGGNNERRKADQ